LVGQRSPCAVDCLSAENHQCRVPAPTTTCSWQRVLAGSLADWHELVEHYSGLLNYAIGRILRDPDEEAAAMLSSAFAQLDRDCQLLLLAIHREQRPMTALQKEAGLGSVQAVYYRKYACLRRLATFFDQRWLEGR
jgi:hypothetical protein